MIGFIIDSYHYLVLKYYIYCVILPNCHSSGAFIDTLFAMIRRMKKGQHIMQADKSHLHHKLLALGYSHRQTVLLIYSIAIMFSFIKCDSLLITTTWCTHDVYPIIFTIELIVEFTGLIDDNYRPILNLITRKGTTSNIVMMSNSP